MNAIDLKTTPRPAETNIMFADLKSDRINMLYSASFGFYTCLTKSGIKDYTESNSATYCHSIKIANSVFQNYNSLKFKHASSNIGNANRFWFAEGMVLAVHNVQGPIVITGNTFSFFL